MQKPTAQLHLTRNEEDVLEFWRTKDIFRRQDEKMAQFSREFSFYDGPPFANGMPHYGHLLHTAAKDAIQRYWIGKGYRIRRRFGWDCHGLPAELEVERRCAISGRQQIEDYGIEAFSEACRDSVREFTSAWQQIVTRMGRWIDWEREQWTTMDPEFMESVWWAFAQLVQRGAIYQDYKVVPYSPQTGSVVSNFEANQNYQDVQDPSLLLKFVDTQDPRLSYLVWTTTPWTLPANVAIALSPKCEYVRVQPAGSDQVWVVARTCLEFVFPPPYPSGSEPYQILGSVTAQELAGRHYVPYYPWPRYVESPAGYRIVVRDFVSDSEGTGLVHQAGAYGEDDYATLQALNLPIYDPLDEAGRFCADTTPWQGLFFKDADKLIVAELKQRGYVLRHSTVVHSYPFDDRTGTPLMYKAVPSWFVAVEKIAPQLVANNQCVRWVPEHVGVGRMGDWLARARDWSISRNRFWGTPVPVWQCSEEHCRQDRVFGSRHELEQACGQTVEDLHLHRIRHLVVPCLACGGAAKNVDLVLDCWFESGAMPFASLHFPFENAQRFEASFPADFICEGMDQTRGWFYTLAVLGTALFGRTPYRNTICTGLILDRNGKKMSKRLGNYTPPRELIERYGADAVRLYLLGSPLLRGENLAFSDEGVREMTRTLLLPLWNAVSFLATYAEAEGWSPPSDLWQTPLPRQHHPLDRWLTSRLHSLRHDVAERMQQYQVSAVVPRLHQFIEDLTNWYIRISRRRFWQCSADGHEPFATLSWCLFEFCKVLAPFAPFMAETLYQILSDQATGLPESIHLCSSADPDPACIDANLEAEMEQVRLATSLGRHIRQQLQIKVRQPLRQLIVASSEPRLATVIAAHEDLLRSELNVHEVHFSPDEAAYVNLELRPNLPVLGRRIGKALREVQRELKVRASTPEAAGALVTKLRESGQIDLAGHLLSAEDILISRTPRGTYSVASEGVMTVILDPQIDGQLRAEGITREFINRVQNLRRDTQLMVSDRIRLRVITPDALVAEALRSHALLIQNEVLAVQLSVITGTPDQATTQVDLEGTRVGIDLERTSPQQDTRSR